jgi:thiamine biosynthesis protein ThiI
LDVGNLEEYSGVALELFEKKIEDILSKTPGIHHFSKVDEAELTIESMKAVLDVCIARDPDGFESFRVTTKRTNKNFSMRAMELNRVLGEHIFETYKKRVDLRHPDRFFYVNIAEKVAYIYSKKQAGIGGLPIGSAGRVVSLLSGGIDSPVASFQLMKRGCEVIAIHAYAKTMDPEKVKEKVLLLAKKLAEVQASLQVYFIPYENIQKEIVQGADQKYRMLLFKRSIVRMANRIAQHVGAMAIVMGDAVGQVASQTLENIQCVYAASDLPVLSPLIAYDKQEIVDLAKKI